MDLVKFFNNVARIMECKYTPVSVTCIHNVWFPGLEHATHYTLQYITGYNSLGKKGSSQGRTELLQFPDENKHS